MVFQNNVIAGAAGSGTTVYEIEQSIRFNDDDSAYLSKTWSGAGDKQKFTFSFWVKRGNITSRQILLSFRQDVPLEFEADDTIRVYLFGTTALNTNRVFRDPSAWYHIVLSVDSTQAVFSERVRLYVNGQRETSFSTASYPSQNASANIYTSTLENYIGRILAGSNYFDGYMAEIHFLDGISYGPEFFGETNSSGIWIPKEYDGSYGTNGYKIDGRDSSDLGDDESGNGNDFTANGLAAHDQVSDSPTNNFCTINSVYADNAAAGNGGTLSNGNLQYVGGGSTFSVKGLTFNLPKSGKWYFEYMIGGSLDGFGFVKQGEQGTINASNGPGQLSVAQGGGIQYVAWRNGGNNTTAFADSNTGSPFTAGFIHQVAIDVDGGKFYYGVKNTYYAADAGSDGNPSAGTNHMSTFAFSTTDVVLLAGNYSGTQYWNFGQDGTFAGQQTAQGNSDANGVGNFYYTVPTGYLALCSKNVGS